MGERHHLKIWTTRIQSFNNQQARLLKDRRVEDLIISFEQACSNSSQTFYSLLSRVGLHILKYGRAAIAHSNIEEADVLLYNNEESARWLQTGTGDKIIILRDRP